MPRIYKYELDSRVTEVSLKTNKILSVINQGGTIVVYAVHDDDIPEEKWLFLLQGTGHELDVVDKMPFLGTVEDGLFVWHTFYGRLKNFNRVHNTKNIDEKQILIGTM